VLNNNNSIAFYSAE